MLSECKNGPLYSIELLCEINEDDHIPKLVNSFLSKTKIKILIDFQTQNDTKHFYSTIKAVKSKAPLLIQHDFLYATEK